MFYEEIEPEINKTAINWRIYSLVKKGILERKSRGVYSLEKTNHYLPNILPCIKKMTKKIQKEFPFLELCIWNTDILNEFTIHQTNQNLIIVEVEKDATQPIFLFLKELRKNVFLEPKKDVFERYIIDINNSIIVKSLVSEAPTQSIDKANTVTLEKILVDIYCDNIIFSAYQGNEMNTIFENAFIKYTVNQSKIVRYANRRGVKKEITELIKQINGK